MKVQVAGKEHETPLSPESEPQPQTQPHTQLIALPQQNSNVPAEVAITDLGTQLKFLGLVEEGQYNIKIF